MAIVLSVYVHTGIGFSVSQPYGHRVISPCVSYLAEAAVILDDLKRFTDVGLAARVSVNILHYRNICCSLSFSF